MAHRCEIRRIQTRDNSAEARAQAVVASDSLILEQRAGDRSARRSRELHDRRRRHREGAEWRERPIAALEATEHVKLTNSCDSSERGAFAINRSCSSACRDL